MGELINHYYAGGPSFNYRSFFWEIPNYDNQSQDKCLSRADATERYSDSVGKLENLYQVKEDCMEEIKIYLPVEYINPEAYRIVTYKELELIPVSQQFRAIIFINWGTNEDNNYQLAGLSYNANYHQGYFVPESFNINTDVMRDYVVDNDGFALYHTSGTIRTTMPIVTSSITQDTLFGLFYNGSNDLFTTDNSFFPMFEEGGDINIAVIESVIFENKDEFINNFGRNISISAKFLLGNSGYAEKVKIYDRYFNLKQTGAFSAHINVTLIDENTLKVEQRNLDGDSQFGGFVYEHKCVEMSGPDGIKTKIFQCNIPLLLFGMTLK